MGSRAGAPRPGAASGIPRAFPGGARLGACARHFPTVEINGSFYFGAAAGALGISRSAINSWSSRGRWADPGWLGGTGSAGSGCHVAPPVPSIYSVRLVNVDFRPA